MSLIGLGGSLGSPQSIGLGLGLGTAGLDYKSGNENLLRSSSAEEIGNDDKIDKTVTNATDMST